MIVLRLLFCRGWWIGVVAACAALGSVGAARAGALKADPSDDLFTNAAVRHLRLEIAEKDMATLRVPVARSRDEGKRPTVPATVREGALTWTNVAVHLKGSFGSFRPVEDKPALTLSFDKLADGQRFHGLQKISLNNSVQDRSFLNEKICREIYTDAGVPVPRADYATVELNGRELGLFVLVEGWNKQFLRRHFANTRGNFYDLLGSHDVHLPREAAFGKNPTNHVALEAVKAAVAETDHAKRLARLRATVDLDRFVTLHALDVMMWNWDGYGMNQNNYRMFHDLEANRIVFFPHGVDQMFGKSDGPIMTGRVGLVARALLETAEGRRLFLERFTQLRTNVFNVHAITNRIAELTARLEPATRKQSVFAFAFQQQGAQRMRELVVARAADVDAQLAGVKHFTPMPLRTDVPLTNWTPRRAVSEVAYSQTTDGAPVLRVQVSAGPHLGVWTTTLWLEEGRYRVEGRVKTIGVQTKVRDEGGAGFRVWSDRKETRGAGWDWFPHGKMRDGRRGGLLPAFTNALPQRLTGDMEWTTLAHEFELRQPLADLQIQCALQADVGTAWFDLSSLKIRRVALNVSKGHERGD